MRALIAQAASDDYDAASCRMSGRARKHYCALSKVTYGVYESCNLYRVRAAVVQRRFKSLSISCDRLTSTDEQTGIDPIDGLSQRQKKYIPSSQLRVRISRFKFCPGMLSSSTMPSCADHLPNMDV